jgi:hypothetical protein
MEDNERKQEEMVFLDSSSVEKDESRAQQSIVLRISPLFDIRYSNQQALDILNFLHLTVQRTYLLIVIMLFYFALIDLIM